MKEDNKIKIDTEAKHFDILQKSEPVNLRSEARAGFNKSEQKESKNLDENRFSQEQSEFLNKFKNKRSAQENKVNNEISQKSINIDTDDAALKFHGAKFSQTAKLIKKPAGIFDKAILWIIYALVFSLPLFLLPFSIEIFEFNKALLLFAVSSLAFLIWIAKMIVIDRRIVFVKTPLDIPIIIFIFIILLSTALSVDRTSSILGFYGRFSDSLMIYLSLAMLYFVGVNSAVLRQAQDDNRQAQDSSKSLINNLIKTFLASSFIVIIVSLSYSFGLKFIPWDETQFRSFNLVAGSLNVLGIYLVSVIIIALYYLLENKNALVKYLVYLLIAASLILLVIIDFMPAWIVLAISLFVSLILTLMIQKRHFAGTRHCLIPTGLIIIVSLIFIATSLTFINKDVESNFESSSISSSIQDRITPLMDNGQIEDGNGFAKEIILDKKTAISIAIEGIKKDPVSGIVGTGPGTYLYNFSKFKPVEFNNSIFWSVRFDKAGSEIIEKISTIGILGTISYLLIIVLTIGMFLRTISFPFQKGGRGNFDGAYLFSAWLSLLLFQFLYLESTTIKFIFWMLTIALAVKYCSSRIQDTEKNIFWDIKIRRSNCIFYLSLLLVITAPIAASYYYQIRFYQAETVYKNTIFAYDKAIKDTSLTKQDARDILDESIESLKEVIEKNPYNGSYKFYLSDIYFNRLAIVIQEESEKNDEEKNNQIIAQEMKNVVDYAKNAADENPNNIFFQQRLGNIYAYMFSNIKIADADEWAIRKYNKAIGLEPSNPILHTELGKIFVSQYSESMAEDRINDAISEFEKALELKSDYLDAGLQLGLAYEIKGDNKKAISQLNSFLESGTADVNLAFQLGRIYYNSGNINEAKNIFLEIARIQPNNSNARYSLGLIYEKEENNKEALREFEAVLFLNPDNQEVVEKIDDLKKLIEKKNKKPEPIIEPVIEKENIEDGAVEEVEE